MQLIIDHYPRIDEADKDKANVGNIVSTYVFISYLYKLMFYNAAKMLCAWMGLCIAICCYGQEDKICKCLLAYQMLIEFTANYNR